MPHSPEELHDEIDKVRRRLNERLDELDRKVEFMEKGHSKILDALQGDSAWKRKGVIDQLAELAAFMETMKGFDFKQMKDFASEYNDFKKKALTISGFIGGVGGILWLIVVNMDKILKALGK